MRFAVPRCITATPIASRAKFQGPTKRNAVADFPYIATRLTVARGCCPRSKKQAVFASIDVPAKAQTGLVLEAFAF